jgi:hypothetical protein
LSERWFRAWDFNVGFGTGEFSAKYYTNANIPNGDFDMYSFGATWKLGFPLFHREYDDRFFWYATSGIGMGFISYDGILRDGGHSYHFIDDDINPKFLDLGMGFETRMGKDWYYNMSANLEVTFGVAANIKVRFLRRSIRKRTFFTG